MYVLMEWERHWMWEVLFRTCGDIYGKVATNLKINALIEYPLHSVLLNVTVLQRRYLIYNSFTLFGFLSVGADDFNKEYNDEDGRKLTKEIDVNPLAALPLNGFIPTTCRSTGKKQKVYSFIRIYGMFYNLSLQVPPNGFPTKPENEESWAYLPLIVLYCSEIPKEKDISGNMHGTIVSKQKIRCLLSIEDIKSLHRWNDKANCSLAHFF